MKDQKKVWKQGEPCHALHKLYREIPWGGGGGGVEVGGTASPLVEHQATFTLACLMESAKYDRTVPQKLYRNGKPLFV